MKDILLVSPHASNEALWVPGAEEGSAREVLNNFPPLGLATVAALTPATFRVRIWDELVHGVITEDTQFDRDYALIGVTGYPSHRRRVLTLGKILRAHKVTTVVGGPAASSEPRAYAPHFDVVFVGEVEKTWPRFLVDWERGNSKSIYYQIEKPDLGQSPLPRWDSIEKDMHHYGMGAIQTTRGCPYDCEFCDVIYLFGRRQRHKPIRTVIEELRTMARFGHEWIFFCDDEFGGDRKYAKALLREIIDFNRTVGERISYSTQMCIAASGDPEFCELLAAANFDMVFVGIESASEEALRGANKLQNLRGDLLENIHKLLSYGIAIRCGMIVGFDEDDEGIFETTYRFLQKACLPSVGIYMLMAPLGTRLWMRLMHEGRVVSLAKNADLGPGRRTLTNIIPKKMTRMQLYRGYRWLLIKVYSWESFAERVCGFISLAANAPPKHEPLAVDAEELIGGIPAGSGALEAARKILRHAEEVAPQLTKRARDLIVQHAKYYATIQEIAAGLESNIAREQSGQIVLERFARAAPLPLSFKNELNRILPAVHRRVFVNLDDESRAPEVLTEVFVDFLHRVGDAFEKFEDHHLALLDELCDRDCAKYNGVPAVDFAPVPQAAMERVTGLPNIKRSRLVDDVYKSVFQKMAEAQRPEPPSEVN
jgi:radical SAM superfamily enzyme YgiQ (UPF0313 family)